MDTNVYIAGSAGNLSRDLLDLLNRSLPFHCTVCLSEIMTGIGNGDPTHSRWIETRDHYVAMMRALPAHRILIPNEPTWLDAGLLAGTLARIQGLQRHQRREVLNDALILLTAARYGMPVLTSDRDDFDLLQQLAPETAFFWY